MKLFRKIDVYYQQGKSWVYACSTQQHKTCKAAAKSWADIHTAGDVRHVRAWFDGSGHSMKVTKPC